MNICSDKVLTCFEKAQDFENDAIAFHRALTDYMKNALCVGDVSDETYEKQFKNVDRFNVYATDIRRYITMNDDKEH